MTTPVRDGNSAAAADGSDVGDAPVACRVPETGGPNWVDRLPGPLVAVLTVAAFALPVGFFLGATVACGVDVLMSDNLSVMPFVAASETRLIPWGPLWAQYNQDRSFFPNVLTVVLAHVDHLDIRVEDVIGALMVVLGTALMIWAHKRRSPSCPWLYYCPVAFVTLSLVQYRNMFLGGVSWYLTFLALATTIALLDAVRSPRVAFVAAIAAAVVGSYSSFAGLLIWPAGLALLYLRGRGWRPMAVWVASGGLAAALYFRGFTFDAAAHPSTGYLSGHLWQATQVFLTAVGDVVGVTITSGSAAGGLVQLLGALVLMVAAVAAVAVVVAVRTRATAGGGPVGVAMIIFGVLFALSIVDGRTGFGPSGASASRYTTFDLLILAGAYLGLLDSRRHTADAPGPTPLRRTVAPLGFAVALVLVGLQVVIGTKTGVQGERAYHRQQVIAAEYLKAYRFTPDYPLSTAVDPWRSASWIRRNASIAEELRLSTFSEPRSQSFDPSRVAPPVPVILLPSAGATVHGTIALDAGTDRSIGVEDVDFVIRGEGGATQVRIRTVLGLYGWAALWNSTDVPDGAYSAVAVSVTYVGRTATSRTVHFHVTNSRGSAHVSGGSVSGDGSSR